MTAPSAPTCPAAAVPIAPKIPAPMTAPIASMMRSPAPSTRLSDCGVSSSLTRSSAIGLRLKSCRTLSLPSVYDVMLRIDDQARDVLDVSSVTGRRRVEQIAHHPFGEFTPIARVLDRGRHLDPSDAPVRGDPEANLVATPCLVRRAGWRHDRPPRRGGEDITRVATRARAGVGARAGPHARPCAAAAARTLSGSAGRSGAGP